jgi:RNA polymerase sigma-70 factor, ECF subfamily
MVQRNLKAFAAMLGHAERGSEQRQALDDIFSLAYEELRRLASSVKRGDRSNTLNPTALVNEAWLKLANTPDVAGTSPLHFKRIAARAMRQLLVEAARKRNAGKRGNASLLITFDESLHGVLTSNQDVLGLNAALDELAEVEPRQAMIVESRFFGGFEINEVAALLGISEATTLRDWRVAKAWLGHKLSKTS